MIDVDPGRGLSAVRPVVPATAANTATWRLGAMVEALILDDLREGVAPVRIGNGTYSAQIPFPVIKGERLLLEVADTNPLPILRPLRDSQPTDPVPQALRRLLPQQGGLSPALVRLEALLTAATAPDHHPPPAIMLAARQLLQSLPTRDAVVTEEGLREALNNSGVFLESKLLRAAPDAPPQIARDLKAGLLRLEQALEDHLGASIGTDANPSAPKGGAEPLLPPLRTLHPTPQSRAASLAAPGDMQLGAFIADLDADIGGALARIQLHQLASQPIAEDPRHFWLLELPIRHEGATDVWQMRLDEKPHERDAPANRSWRVEMAFDLPGTGPVVACIELRNDQVSVRFWAEHSETATLFGDHLDALESRLAQAGVVTGSIACHHGRPRQPAAETPRTNLLNLTA